MKMMFKFFLALTIFLLPWQTRWIFFDQQLFSNTWEYGRLSLYANMLTLLLALIFYLAQKNKIKIKNIFDKFSSKLLALTLIYFWLINLWQPMPEVTFYYVVLLASTILFIYLLKQVSKKFVITSFFASGIIQGLLAIWQILQQQVIANKWLGLAEHLPATLGTSVVEHGLDRILRAYGSLPHPNILGGFLVLAALAGLWWWQHIYSQAAKDNWAGKNFKKHIAQLLFVLVGQLIIIFALLLTFSRSAVLSLLLTLIIIFVWSLYKKKYLITQILVKILIVFALIFLMLHILFPGAWISRFQSDQRLEVKSTTERLASTQQIDWHNPKELIFGQGFGLNTYRNLESSQPAYEVQPIHNVFLLSLAEVGIIGFILLINLIYLYWPRHLAKDWFWWASAFLIIGLFDHYFWTTWAGWMMVAIIWSNLISKKE
ncbi:O-antigen ligase family protein [bacterium]|jgi:O-antigen ligase|nr:O-antigen ligase family protein [bacterium]